MHDWESPNRTYIEDNARRLRKGDRLVSLNGISGPPISTPYLFEGDSNEPANVQFETEDWGNWTIPAATCLRIDTTDREET